MLFITSKLTPSRRKFVIRAGELIAIILCLPPALFFSLKALQSPWSLFRIARAELSLSGDQLVAYSTAAASYRPEHLGGELLSLAWRQATGWPAEWVSLLPVGALLLALVYYGVALNLTQSRIASAAIAVYASWYYPRLNSQFATHLYSWTNVLFLVFLLIFYNYLKQKNAHRSIYIIVVFTAVFLHYQTTPIWIIGCLVSAVVLVKFKITNISDSYRTSTTWALPLFAIVTYLTFDTVAYGNGLKRLQSDIVGESLIQSLTSKVLEPLLQSGASREALPPYAITTTSPRLATWTTLLILILLTAPIGYWCIQRVVKIVMSRARFNLGEDAEELFIWTVVLAAALHALMYLMYGAISLRVIPLAFPLILPLVLRRLIPYRYVQEFSTIIVALLAVIGFISFAPTLKNEVTSSGTGAASLLLHDDSKVLSGGSTFGALQLAAAENSKVLDFVWLDSELYRSTIGEAAANRQMYDHLVIDKTGKAITSSNWLHFEAWSRNIVRIDSNAQLQKVYDSDNISIYQPSGVKLSSEIITQSRLFRETASFAFLVARSIFAVLILAFLPGGLFLLLSPDQSFLEMHDSATFVSLAIGLSIALTTFLGYVINFSSASLNNYLWLLLLFSALLFILIVLRGTLAPEFSQSGAVVVLLSIVVLWALASTLTAVSRTESQTDIVEFFATSNSDEDSLLTFHIVNRSSQENEFEIMVKSTVAEEHIGPLLLGPNQHYTTSWQIPLTSEEDWIFAQLLEDDESSHGIHLKVSH